MVVSCALYSCSLGPGLPCCAAVMLSASCIVPRMSSAYGCTFWCRCQLQKEMLSTSPSYYVPWQPCDVGG